MPAIKSDSGESTAAAGRKSPAAVFDLAALVRRSMNDRSLAAMLVEKFTGRLARSVEDIQQMIAASDWSAAAVKVHTLKGEAGSLAAVHLHAAATRLEQCLRAGRYAEAPSHLSDVQGAAAECLASAQAALSQLAAGADIRS